MRAYFDPGARAKVAWCFYDFANSAFPTIALTAFGGTYFVTEFVGPKGLTLGPIHLGPSAAWGFALSSSMLLVTLSSPFVGAFADRGGNKRAWLCAYTLLCIAATASLGVLPQGAALAALGCYVVANFAFEGAYVFYNAFLPELVPPERVGRLSGIGWALGYVGGLLALAVGFFLSPSNLNSAGSHASGWMMYTLVAAWFLVFALPALLVLRDRRATRTDRAQVSLREVLRGLSETLRSIRKYRAVAIFLAAFFLYNDGIITVIEFTGVYTREALGFGPRQTIALFLVLNAIAAPGALIFGSLTDRWGGKAAIQLSLVGWVVVAFGAMLVRTQTAFWWIAVLAALVIGATQSASRALLARLAPPEHMAEFMGFMALSGKGSAIVGPLLYGFIVEATARPGDSGGGHRWAIGTVGGVFLIAFFVLQKLDEKQGIRDAAAEKAA